MWTTERTKSKERQMCHHRHEELQIPRGAVCQDVVQGESLLDLENAASCLILVRAISTESQGRTWLL